MTPDIDDLIREGAPAPSTGSLGTLEAGVWQKVGHHHARATASRLQAGALAIALMVGAVGGGVMLRDDRPADADLHILTVEAGLAPFGVAGDLG